MRRGAVAVLLALVPVLFVVPLADAEPAQSDLWYLDAMKAVEAQEVSQGEGVTVAVVDTGVDPEHIDLRGRVLEGAVITADGPQPGDTSDRDGHGTAMAGLIAGSDTDSDSLIGIAPEARILPVRIDRDADGTLDQDLVYEGVRWAIDQGAQVVNLSLTGRGQHDDAWKRELIEYALEHDAVIVAAVGNRTPESAEVGEPAAIPGVIAVSGMGKDGEVWSGSLTGDQVVLCAPAEDLPHLRPGGGMRMASGTSAATALVSGTVALIRSAHPDASAAEVVTRLVSTATEAGDSGRDPEYGFGTVDAYAALTTTVSSGEQYPLDLPDAPAVVEIADGDVGGWWLAAPALVAVLAGGAAFLWLMRRSKGGRRMVPAESDA
ncbi:type VII secretion-associated serine protease mycosin [Stackebrandtia albiflava]|uniref:Type VII secretion-associated serine protease mycosin n=1 Tax=Stackebrandtia albiflava TaxID=406432 RepID=A0A562V317_9ACTN|nr:S8 family serine peptidase [Stackebrandtia albiflava]TWJ12274.1 type VII secretion-associated serine protease mycosin [Stackebrandtia albiflava]